MEVGKRITELREQVGITTNKLANQCGLSQSFVRAVELGEKGINVENLKLICDTLHSSLRDFFDVPDAEIYTAGDSLQAQIQRLSETQKAALSAFSKVYLKKRHICGVSCYSDSKNARKSQNRF